MIDMESVDMCDVKKYYNIYDEIKKLKPEDTLQLVMEAENDEEKQFFEMLGNYLLQEKQNKVIGIYSDLTINLSELLN